MYPKIKFIISVKSDTENALWFIRGGQFVDWFLPSDFQFVLSKNFSSLEKNKIITQYTGHIYKTKEKEILEGVNEVKKEWLKIEKKFFDISDKIFQNYPWPKGKYIGYASIFSMFPRDIKDKIFFFPYSSKDFRPLVTIAHEMLHFIFFDYIKKKYKINEGTELKGEDKQYVWRVSETFNTVIENWQPYKNIFSQKSQSKPYPGCEKMFTSMTKQWNKNQDINKFLDKWFDKKTLK